jgi:hypothetical protein
MMEDDLLNTPVTALVILGTDTAIAMATNANMIAYSTIVTPSAAFFFLMVAPGSTAQNKYDQHGGRKTLPHVSNPEESSPPNEMPGSYRNSCMPEWSA